MFYSKCMPPASLATLWSTCHVLLKVYATSLSCHLVERLSCFIQSVSDQLLLPPCGALVTFYSKCTQPASLATLWSTCHVLLTLYVASLSCSVSSLYVNLHSTVEHLSHFTQLYVTSLPCNPVEILLHFTQTVPNQPLLQCFRVVCQPCLLIHI